MRLLTLVKLVNLPTTYYYNGKTLIENKTILAKTRANGIMFWELGQDGHGVKSLIKAALAKLQKRNKHHILENIFLIV